MVFFLLESFFFCVSGWLSRILSWSPFGVVLVGLHLSFFGCSSRFLSLSPLLDELGRSGLASFLVFFVLGSCPSVSLGHVFAFSGFIGVF